MEKDFELETILTFTTGINCTNDFGKTYELAWFVFGDNFSNANGLGIIKDELREHLLGLHPQLNGVTYNAQFETSFDAWLLSQKFEHGETLPVCQIGQTLNNNQCGKTRR